MSHSKERQEKICLNCGANLYGRYCHSCGQENTEPKTSAWHLVTHFFYDITHFDGKFFTTVKDLLFKPGFLSKEYTIGRRASYLDPIRMYVFTSATFFIMFFSIFNVKNLHLNSEKITPKNGFYNVNKLLQERLAAAKTHEDSVSIKKAMAALSQPVNITVDTTNVSKLKKKQKLENDSTEDDDNDQNVGIMFGSEKFKTVAEYDSSQIHLSAGQRDGMTKHFLKRKMIDLNERFKKDKAAFIREWIEAFLHNFPKMLFVSLPLFALLLKLLYVRRKQFYYVSHGIFAIHLYIYSFIALMIIFAISSIVSSTGWNWLGFLTAAVVIYSLYYFYKAMRVFYQQGRFKTFLKYLLLNFLSFIVIILLFFIFFLFSAFAI